MAARTARVVNTSVGGVSDADYAHHAVSEIGVGDASYKNGDYLSDITNS